MIQGNEALGIEDDAKGFIITKEGQDKVKEYEGILEFLYEASESKSIPEFQNPNKKLQFINYGGTELVYVLTVGNKKYTMLVNQPIVEFGTVKKEFDNLQKLSQTHPDNVVKPMYYLTNQDKTRELYVTPYSYQARDILQMMGAWGMYIPEPNYYFCNTGFQISHTINSCIIATLIRMFDSQNNLGLASCRIAGGDFMLEKEQGDFDQEWGVDESKLTREKIMNKLKLTAAREFISVTLEEYIELIRKEFSTQPYQSEEKNKRIYYQ